LRRIAMNTSLTKTAVTDDVVSRKAGRKKPGDKVSKVMSEFNTGDLKSSSGQPVKKKSQALAIAMSEAGKAKKACDCADKKSCNC
jgi:hypothetical protein